ncbi:MAG: ABC transporter substrate-binding protein [Kiritimatiellia bacterium]|nr:ABC transporter substrate-binding protein [Kiritimatiellia bacterium]
MKSWILLCAAIGVLALPFVARRWTHRADPVGPTEDVVRLVIVSPHNEAIRQEFGRAFARWHEERTGKPARIDWLVIGGTTEIARYLNSEFISSVRAWWTRQGNEWPSGAGEALLDARFPQRSIPAPGAPDRARWDALAALHARYRDTDDPSAFSTRIDLFFGGGTYDHARAEGQGMTVAPWAPGMSPAGLFESADGTCLIPERLGGEIWRTDTYLGTVVSTFGICYNPDRLRQIGYSEIPRQWDDLADPRLSGQVAVADPTKSGSIAKAFEMIVHQQCARAVTAAGYTEDQVDRFEAAIRAAGLPRGEMPEGVPEAYQKAIEDGWLAGIRLIRRIGANARYFTDAAGKVVLDVAQGEAAAGLAIDFYARYQAQVSRSGEGIERMQFITPPGGSSVSADPISLLRGAEHRETALRFIEFVLSEEGQRLWSYRVGAPGGPTQFSLRRLPIRRDFYPSGYPAFQRTHERHRSHSVEDLAAPEIDPYALAERFIYRERWTASHFGIHRDLIRAMCLDSYADLRAAWTEIHRRGDLARQPAALEAFERMPGGEWEVTWKNAPDFYRGRDRQDVLREWSLHFRRAYREARRLSRDATPIEGEGS